MPRGFTEREKAEIHRALLLKGRAFFETLGLRKTSVEQLTTAVGISKGAFYLFFSSKEELCFAVLQEYEAEVRGRLVATIDAEHGDGRARFRAMLWSVLQLWRSQPLTARIGREEYALLLRALPLERVAEHHAADERFADEFVAHWARAGVVIRAAPQLVAELIRSLFFLSLHADEFGAGTFESVMAVLIDGIVEQVVAAHEVDP